MVFQGERFGKCLEYQHMIRGHVLVGIHNDHKVLYCNQRLWHSPGWETRNMNAECYAKENW